MDPENLIRISEEAVNSRIVLARDNPGRGGRIGVFPSSFNPPTAAHLRIVESAIWRYSVDEVLALVSLANADKLSYDCPIHHRLAMTLECFSMSSGVSIGVTSEAFFVDLVDAVKEIRTQIQKLFFITGLDTYSRILDPDDKYSNRYKHQFDNRIEALHYLLSNSELLVADRSVGNSEAGLMDELLPESLRGRVHKFGTEADFAYLSSTIIRGRLSKGESITGLLPSGVEQYINRNSLYT